MSGIYFIAAGQSTKNRDKSLDRRLRAADMQRMLSDKKRSQIFTALRTT